MAKKRRKKKYPQTRALPYRMPPLGWKDHLLYLFLMLFFVALAIAVFPLRGWITHTFFAVEGEYVVESSRGAGGLVAFPAILLFMLAPSILVPYNMFCYPVFGRKDVEYGPPRYEPIHPLLARDKPAYRDIKTKKQQAKEKKIRRIVAVCLVVICVFNVSMFVLSLGHSVFFRPDGSIDDYGIFNRECRTYTPEDISRVKLKISDPTIPLGKHGGRRLWTYGMCLIQKTETSTRL